MSGKMTKSGSAFSAGLLQSIMPLSRVTSSTGYRLEPDSGF